MVEISRVLKPGGIFVASTFLKTFSPLGELLGDDFVRPLNQVCKQMHLSYTVCLVYHQHAGCFLLQVLHSSSKGSVATPHPGWQLVQVALQLSSTRSLPYRWWEEQELRDLTASMGLQNFSRHRNNRFILFAVSKPSS